VLFLKEPKHSIYFNESRFLSGVHAVLRGWGSIGNDVEISNSFCKQKLRIVHEFGLLKMNGKTYTSTLKIIN